MLSTLLMVLVIPECKMGYFGDFCDEPCPPDFYGLNCGGNCSPRCTKEDCHHISGFANDKMTTPNPLKMEPSIRCYMLENTMTNKIIDLFTKGSFQCFSIFKIILF